MFKIGKLRNLELALGLISVLGASACDKPCERPHVEPVEDVTPAIGTTYNNTDITLY